MGVWVKNANLSISLSLTALRLVGFWPPEALTENEKLLYYCYAVFVFMCLLGTYIIIQVVDLFLIWGNLPLMTGTAFLLFTNLAQVAKIVNLLARRKIIQEIIEEADGVLTAVQSEEAKEIVRSCDRETTLLQRMYLAFTLITGLGWATSAEKNQLPLRAWYPYDTSKSPAYELTYFHQVSALFIAATLNVGKDTLVTALIAQCRCRFRLLGLALRTLCQDMDLKDEVYDTSKSPAYELTYFHQVSALFIAATLNVGKDTLVTALIAQCRCRFRLLGLAVKTLCQDMELRDEGLTAAQESTASSRLRACVTEHRAALQAAVLMQHSFSEPTFMQFNVSLIIICVTAFQLISMTGNLVRLLSMGTYLVNMMFQVFIYCYQGNQLSEESSEIAGAVYQCPWYLTSVKQRRALLVVMVRSRRVARLQAGNFTTLSLASFMAIIKASYSLFTLLRQVEEKKQ